jgi:hypothetical protein
MKIIEMDITTATRVLGDKELWPEHGLDPSKPVLLAGEPGVGKSTLMEKVILPSEKAGHRLTARDINDEYENFGYKDLEDRKSKFKYWKEHGMYIDDLGNEPSQVAYFGSLDQPVVRVLEERYAAGSPTWISTNKTIEDIEKKYGPRVSSRLKETNNIVYIIGKSFRD